MNHDDVVSDEYERGLRSRGKIGWVLGAIALGAIGLVFGQWCRTIVKQQAPRPPRPLTAEERAVIARRMPELERGAAQIEGRRVPPGFGPAVLALDGERLRGTPPCPEHVPAGAHAFSPEELARAPLRSQPRIAGPREVIVLGTHVAPRLASRTEYHAGLVEGVAYLWDDTTGTILCAGHVRAESADRVDYLERGFSLGDAQLALDRDLVIALDGAVAGALHVVAPPPRR